MVGFSWNHWVGALRVLKGSTNRRPRQVRMARVEGLEDRALLTANLPVAVADSYQVNVDSTLIGTSVLDNDTDADNDSITEAILASGVSHGSLNLQANGTFTYTPATGFSGTDSFTYYARDAANNENSSLPATVTIQVGTAGNSPPVGTPITINVTADTQFAGGLAGTDTDGNTLTFSQGNTLAQHGTVVINSNGSFTYTPATGYTGNDSFSFKVNDGQVDSSSDALVTVHVGAAGNQAPTANSISINVALNTQFAGGLSGNDPDGDTLVFSPGAVTAAHGTVVINSDGNFTYTPDTGYSGNDSFSFKVSDGAFESITDGVVTVQVGTVGNHAPTATATSINVTLNTQFAGGLSGFDQDGDPLTFSQGSTVAAHGVVNISGSGLFTYTPNTGYTGSDSFSFKVNDGSLNSADALVTVQVAASANTPPVANPVSIEVALNTTFAGGLSATDVDGDNLTFSLGSSAAAHGTVLINPNGSFTYTPATGYTGSDSFSFKVFDGTVNSADATVTVQVAAPINHAPIANPTSISVAADTLFAGGLTATDIDNDILTFSLGTTVAAHGTVALNPNGSFTYTPNAGYTGTDSFSFKVNDGTVNSAEATVSVQVGAVVNHPPIATPTSISVTTNTTFNGTLQGTDEDGNTLSFLAGTTAAAHGTVNINANGTFTYTPETGYSGPDSFTFRVNDGIVTSANATVTVQVGAAINHPPVASPSNISVATDTTFTGSLTATDSDGDPLTFSLGTTAAAHGTVTINPDGTFLYVPASGFIGTDSFSFKVNDGTVDSAEATVSIVIGAQVNTPPVANPTTINVAANGTFTGLLTGMDVDGDSLTFLAGGVAPSHGTVQISSNGSFTYTPENGYSGDDFFSFKTNDGTVDSVSALVVVHVGGLPNNAPTVISGNGTTELNVAFSGSVSPLAVDLDGDTLAFSVVTTTSHGTLSLNPDGTFLYTPDVGFTGTDSFTFKANDGTVDSGVATFNVTVTAATAGYTVVLPSASGSIATSMRNVTPLDPAAGLINIDPNAVFANASLNATITSGASRQDRFVIRDGATTVGSIDVRGRRIFFNGTEVARITSRRAGNSLDVDFNSNASSDAITAVMERIGLKTTRRAGNETRVVRFRVSANGGSSQATIEAHKV